MRNGTKILLVIAAIVLLLPFMNCKKYLDEKSDKKLVIPTTLADLQALLDNYFKITISPGHGEASADDYYLTDVDYSSLNMESYRRTYRWEGQLLFDRFPNTWSQCYEIVYYSNIALQGLQNIERTTYNSTTYDNVLGQAYFYRGYVFSELAVQWCKGYDGASAGTDLGLPIRMNSDFNVVSYRSSLQDTYQQIISDLKASAQALPISAVHVYRPCKAAAYAALARVYLSMRDYDNAFLYADSSLAISNKLIDYNTLNANATFPVPAFNTEILYQADLQTLPNIANSRGKIDSNLYKLYANDDLRKSIFFKSNNNGTYGFRGSYEASANYFGGIATDEVYLIRAECNARKGNLANAMADLNTLMKNRWLKTSFVPLTAASQADALSKILLERRKELLMRGIRWSDLKRFNLEGANIVLKRIINGQTYTLPPNDPRYALPLPEDLILLTGMPQNPR